ncbi:MAG TPA: thiamine pyrophosphate-binding protein [Stellaceae bacterium]|nr:thiamine pyrophosphate-binding protein [Stellaceae bacterium]
MSSAVDPASAALVRGAARAKVDACVYLPDSSLTRVLREFQRTGVRCIPCAREDEGVAIAAGLHLGGSVPVCLMEASGLGYSGLILARAQVQRTPVVIVASHSRGGGEAHDYHGATILVSEGIFSGLNIPYEIARDADTIEAQVYRVIQTAQSQLTSFGLLVPPYVMEGGA